MKFHIPLRVLGWIKTEKEFTDYSGVEAFLQIVSEATLFWVFYLQQL